MVALTRSHSAWDTQEYESVLKDEIRSLPAGTLPLHGATLQGGIVDDSDVAVSVLNSRETGGSIESRVYVFFEEITGGCNCHDDPTGSNLHCELLVSIDKQDASTEFKLVGP